MLWTKVPLALEGLRACCSLHVAYPPFTAIYSLTLTGTADNLTTSSFPADTILQLNTHWHHRQPHYFIISCWHNSTAQHSLAPQTTSLLHHFLLTQFYSSTLTGTTDNLTTSSFPADTILQLNTRWHHRQPHYFIISCWHNSTAQHSLAPQTTSLLHHFLLTQFYSSTLTGTTDNLTTSSFPADTILQLNTHWHHRQPHYFIISCWHNSDYFNFLLNQTLLFFFLICCLKPNSFLFSYLLFVHNAFSEPHRYWSMLITTQKKLTLYSYSHNWSIIISNIVIGLVKVLNKMWKKWKHYSLRPKK